MLSAARSGLKDRMEEPTADLNQAAAEFAGETRKAAGMLKGKDYQVVLPEERRGSLRHEVWEGISGSDLNSLTSHPKFKSGGPDFTVTLEQPKARRTRGMISGEKSAASSRLPRTEPIGFGSMRTTNASSNSTTPEKTPTGPRRFFAFLRTLQPIGAKLSNPDLFLSARTDVTTSRFCTRKAEETISAPWVGPCRTAPSNAPFPGSVFSYPTSIGPKPFPSCSKA